MPALNWRHHALIQAVLTRGPLMEKEFHKLFKDATGKNPGTNPQDFNDYLLKINKELSYVQFELRVCRFQYDGQACYGVVNNVSDEQSKLGTKYSVPQIAFYKGIIEAIVQDVTAQGSISNVDALNIRLEDQVTTATGSQSQGDRHHVPPALRNFSMSQKDKTLDELVRDQWLCYIPDGNIGLGVRSFLDLRSWFHNTDVPSCEVCNEAGVKAQCCQNEGCTVRIHQYCLKKKFSQRRGEIVCPGCGTQWHYQLPKAETIKEDVPNGYTQNQPPPGPSQSQLPVEPTRKRLRRSKTDVDTVGCGSSQASQANTDLRRTTRSSSRLR